MIDYFTLFALPKSVDIDLLLLEQSYLRMQQVLHPDNFVGNIAEQQIASQKSAELNLAYKTLKDRFSRIDYLASQLNVDKQSQPQELLVEMMELREQLDDRKLTANDIQQSIDAEYKKIAKFYNDNTTINFASSYARIKFLRRLRDYFL